jgi:HK97 family phage portal protein
MGLLKKGRTIKAATPFNQITYTLVNNQWLSPEDNGQTYIDNGYKKLPNLYALISWIIRKSSIVPFQVLKVKNQSAARKYKTAVKMLSSETDMYKFLKLKNEAFQEVEGSDLEKLLDSPNPNQSGVEFNEALDGYLLLTGNSYVYTETPGEGKNAKKPKELYVIPSPCVTPITNKSLEIEKYDVSYYPNKIDAEFIGHMKYFNPVSTMENPAQSLVGMSPLMACRNLIGKYKSADIAQGAMFTNMGPSGILTGDGNGDLSEEQAQAVKDKFKQYHQGATKAGDITVTPAKLNWTQIGISPVDLNIIDGKDEILTELCNVYGLPKDLFSGSSSKYDNSGQARKIAITDAIIPVCERRKQLINRWLAPKFGDNIFIEYDYSVFDEMQEDLKTKVEWLSKMWQLTPNQILGELGFEESQDPNMNKVYIPQNLVSLEDANTDLDLDTSLLESENINDV